MPVTVHNFNGIASLQFSLEWNTSVLEFKEVTNFNLPDLAVSNFNTTGATNGQIALAWFDNTAQGVILQNGATAFEVCFEVKGTNGQSSNITFTDTPTAREAATANATINFTQTNGRVTVGEEVTPATSIINIGNTNASSGSSICIPVTAKDFDAIASMQFSLQWDANVLEFTGTQNFGLPDLSSASFNTTGANNGNISVTWFNQAGTGLTLQDNDTIFVLCYNVKGSSGSSTAITFTDTPTPRELATASGPITFTSTNGAVTVTGGPPPGDAILNIGDIQGEPGSTVCVPIVVKDFNTIASMQFSLGWDTNVLKFVETKNYNLKDLSNANLSTGNAENGQIAVAWFDQAAVGVTLPDGTTLLEICFEVVGTQGQSTTIQFTDVPTQRELATANGTIEFTSANGTFTVGGDPPPPTGKLVNIGTVNVTSGESFCTPITVNDFDAIASIQFSLGWDASVIEFTGVQSFGLQDLSAASFNTGGATNGAISVAWFDNSAQGVTLADGTTLFEACFTAVGANGTNTIIAFTDTPTQREASTSNATITFTQNNGTVNVGMGSCDPITVTSASTNVTCNGASNGTITVNAAGGDGSFTYQWSDASIGNTANATGLAPGTYTLTITSCGGQGTNESVSVTITEPPAIISVVTPEDASCFGTPDGRINISILGGTLPYTYTWSDTTLAPANRPVNALAGVYSLTITDGNDCEDVTNNIVISSPTQITGTVTTTPASCSGKPDGSATITPSGGSGSGYTYDWGDSSITGASPTNVPSGTHTVTITDGNNCTGTVAVTIGATVTITATAQVIEDACGNSKGGIQITPTGGASPYTYAWSGPATIGNTNTAENIPTGTYIVTITDNNDCSIVETIEVGGPVATLSTSATIDNVDCPGDTDGSITLTTAGGFGPYTYAWSNGATTDEIEDLSPGTYTVTITDSKVCTYEETFTVGTTSNLAVSVTINNGAPNASATAVVTGGVMPYEYEWCNGQTTPTATGLDQGICSVTIIDSLGCTVVENINITEDKPKPQILVSNPINCAGEKNGILQVQVADGKGPFNYAWNTGANSNILVNVGAGTYMVTVTDANNNMGVDTFQFGEPDSIKIVANSITAACMQDGGSIEITISGGTAPYKSIAWSNDIKDVLKLEGLRIGEYAVIVTDSSDCTAQRNFQINTDTSCVGCYTSNLVMTPNEDGLNDAFRLNCADNAPNNHLEIYNRWGQLVFEADNYQCVLGTESDCWKGKNRSGRIVDEGGYFWVFEFDDNNTRRRIRNHVTLLFED
jgi:gliding motility-associated-like protein